MPRKPTVRWSDAANAYRCDVGPVGANGRRKPKYFRELPNTPKGLRLAEAQLAEFLRDRDKADAEHTNSRDNPRVWSALIEPYLLHLAERVKAGGSRETYRSHLDRLRTWGKWRSAGGVPIRDRLVRSLTDDDAAAWVASLRAQGRSAVRIKGLMTSANACLNWAAAPLPGRIPKVILPGGNPFAGVKVPTASPGLVRVATRGEVARFLRAGRAGVEAWRPGKGDQCGGCKRAGRPGPCRRSHNRRSVYHRLAVLLCRLQAAVGTRPKELCEATWESQVRDRGVAIPGWTADAWVDDAGLTWGMICVPGKTYSRTGRYRLIPVPPPIRRAIERSRERGDGMGSPMIFPRGSRGEGFGRWTTSALDNRAAKWRAAAKLGPDFVLYALRHRFYSAAVNRAGLSTDQAGAIGGTSGKTVGAVYLHRDDRAVFEGAAKVRDAAKPRPGPATGSGAGSP